MPLYMTQVSYTPDVWARQMEDPKAQANALGDMLRRAGCKMVSFYYAFGDYDAVLITEAPDNVTIASVLIAAAGGGALSSLRSTVLMTADEGVEAISRAKSVGYAPPSW